MDKNILGKLFLIIALVSVIFAIVCFTLDVGNIEWDESYGGDAYTGIQNAAAETANNLVILNLNITRIAGFAFIITTLTFASIGISLLRGERNSGSNGTPSRIRQYQCSVCMAPINYGDENCEQCGTKILWDLR